MEIRPTFIKAAIMDWKHTRITTGRLFEILRVPYYGAYCVLLNEQTKTGKWFDISAMRIEQLLMTDELIKEKALRDLKG